MLETSSSHSSGITFAVLVQGTVFGNSVALRLFAAFAGRPANRARRQKTTIDDVTTPAAGRKRWQIRNMMAHKAMSGL